MAIDERKADPIVVAVINSHLENILDEMGRVVIRTSRSPILTEALDFGVAIFDKDMRLIGQREYNAGLAAAIPVGIRSMVEAFKDDTAEGDVILHNDPYNGNNHIPDLNIAKPVFYQGQLLFWSAVKQHMIDTGSRGVAGYDPTSRTIYEDGFRIPPVKLFERGKLVTAIRDIIKCNIKVPDIYWGDVMCGVGGCTVGERNFLAMLEQYGIETLYGAIDEILAATEAEMRERISLLPDGVYYGEKSTDHDGILRDRPITAKVQVIKKGDEITVDFSDSDPQVPGYMNSSWANTYSVCSMILGYALPGAVKRNEGSLSPITIKAKRGTFANPEFPASVTMCTTNVTACLGEALLIALSTAIPDYVAAAPGNMVQAMARGYNPRTNRLWAEIDFFMRNTPSGGTEGYDGWDLGGTMASLGKGRFPDLEIMELYKPAHILQCEQVTDSAGDGKFRSGMGHIYRIQYLHGISEGVLIGAGMRDYSVPSGLLGGKNPDVNEVFIHRAGGTTEKLEPHIFLGLQAGDILEQHSQGGGGFGDPLDRGAWRVRDDVKNELISFDKARDVYGVVIDPETFEVDEGATEELRLEKKRRKK
ncbi:hydantoinase B/oxoprolinase family protein [Chloroflexota bacterium]